MLGEDIVESSWVYALAADMYNNDPNGDTILTDAEYDQLTNILCLYWSEIPDVLKILFVDATTIQTTGGHILLSPKQRKIAENVYNQYIQRRTASR